MDKREFCEWFMYLGDRPISFRERPYLGAVYRSTSRNLVLRCSRQTEKSTFLANSILYDACTNPGITMLLVAPRFEQARTFCHTRLLQCLDNSPLIRQRLMGARTANRRITHMTFANGSQLFVRAAFLTADSCRGLSIEHLYIDEYQDIAPNHLPVLQETLSHAMNGRTVLAGTPKFVDNCLEAAFSASTANEWTIGCSGCKKGIILDERALGPRGLRCPDCQEPLDPRDGSWVPRNPSATWGDGFWICHPMVPWLNYEELLERQVSYDPVQFKNECLGLPTTLGDHIVSRAELEACCGDYEMAASAEDIGGLVGYEPMVGLDWGGGGMSSTVLVIGVMRPDYTFQVVRMDRFRSQEDPDRVLEQVVSLCAAFGVRFIAADGGGNGNVYNRLLVGKLGGRCRLCGILYSAAGSDPQQDGALWKWIVGRSPSIGVVFGRIKNRQILFPQVEESGSFLDEFACETAVYDDHLRAVRYTHPETKPDDALHATNYALLLAIRHYQKMQASGSV